MWRGRETNVVNLSRYYLPTLLRTTQQWRTGGKSRGKINLRPRESERITPDSTRHAKVGRSHHRPWSGRRAYARTYTDWATAEASAQAEADELIEPRTVIRVPGSPPKAAREAAKAEAKDGTPYKMLAPARTFFKHG